MEILFTPIFYSHFLQVNIFGCSAMQFILDKKITILYFSILLFTISALDQERSPPLPVARIYRWLIYLSGKHTRFKKLNYFKINSLRSLKTT